MQIVIEISDRLYKAIQEIPISGFELLNLVSAVRKGTPIPKGHGRLGDLDELEKRISSFVEHDAKITDEYTVTRQRFIVNGIHETLTIIEADNTESEE